MEKTAAFIKNLLLPPFSEREVLILSLTFALVLVEYAVPVFKGAAFSLAVFAFAGPAGVVLGLLAAVWAVAFFRGVCRVAAGLTRMAGSAEPLSRTEKRLFAYLFYLTLSAASLLALWVEVLRPELGLLTDADLPAFLLGRIGEGLGVEDRLIGTVNRTILLLVAGRTLITFLLTWFAGKVGDIDPLADQMSDRQVGPVHLAGIVLMVPILYMIGRFAYPLPTAVTLTYFYGSGLLHLTDGLQGLRFLNRYLAIGLTVAAAAGLFAWVVRVELGNVETLVAHHERRAEAAWKEGRTDAAVGEFERALEIRIRRRGEDHPSVGSGHYRLGIAHLKRGDGDKALDHLGRALAIRGGDPSAGNAEIAAIHRHIGLASLHAGDLSTSDVHLTRALGLLAAASEARPMDGLAVRRDLGVLHFLKNDYASAVTWFQKAEAAGGGLVNPADPVAIDLAVHQGLAHEKLGDDRRMIASFERALSAGEEAFEAAWPEPAAVYLKLGLGHYRTGTYKRAVRFLGKAEAAHPERVRYPLGSALLARGQPWGLDYLTAELDHLVGIVGPDHPALARIYYEVGAARHLMGGRAEAIVEPLARALALRRDAGGATPETGPDPGDGPWNPHYDPDLSPRLEDLAERLADALKTWLAGNRGYVNADVAAGLYQLGAYAAEQGRNAAAVRYLREARDMLDALRGPDHPETRRAGDLLEILEGPPAP